MSPLAWAVAPVVRSLSCRDTVAYSQVFDPLAEIVALLSDALLTIAMLDKAC